VLAVRTVKKPMPSLPANWRVPPTRPQPQLTDDDKPPQSPRGMRRIRRMQGPLGVLAGLVVVVVLAQTPPGHTLMRLTGLTKAPAAYTALYFPDPGGLPSTVPSGHVQLNVSFAIHNATQSADSYKWTVQFLHGSKTAATDTGTTSVPSGGTKAETRSVNTLCQSGTLEVTVRLAAPAESIHFKATCNG
jgi:hypothetical protein